jgi:hypothetical protein
MTSLLKMSSVDETHGKIDLNIVLDALGNRDSLDLRRFSRFLEPIDIFAHDGRGDLSVEYKHRLAHMGVERMFKAFDGGRTLVWVLKDPVTSLMDLPYTALPTIWKYAISTPAGITLDLNTHTVRGLDHNPFQMFRAFRMIDRGLHDAVQLHVPLDISMTSTVATTDFGSFTELGKLMFGGRSQHIIEKIAQTVWATSPL